VLSFRIETVHTMHYLFFVLILIFVFFHDKVFLMDQMGHEWKKELKMLYFEYRYVFGEAKVMVPQRLEVAGIAMWNTLSRRTVLFKALLFCLRGNNQQYHNLCTCQIIWKCCIVLWRTILKKLICIAEKANVWEKWSLFFCGLICFWEKHTVGETANTVVERHQSFGLIQFLRGAGAQRLSVSEWIIWGQTYS
jgi:hypothetical protein